MNPFSQRILLATFAFLVWGCASDRIAGTNDETHTEAARIFKPGGTTVATGAVVKVVPRDSTQGVAFGSVDSAGHPQTSYVPDGIYTVSVGLGGLVSTIDSVKASAGRLVLVQNDTLQPSGTLSGVVAMQPQDDPTTVTVQILGTENWANVHGDGTFTLGDLPTGKVRLRLVTTLQNYTPTFDTSHSTTGVDTRIADTIHMIFTGIPVVTGLSVANDSATGQLVLSWHPVAYSHLLDYLVFRDTAGAIAYSAAPFAASMDTLWRDTASDSLAVKQAWRYRVVVRNRSATSGSWTESVTGVSVPPALRRVDSATWVEVGRGGTILGSIGSGRMATIALGSGGSTRTFSVRSSADGLLWDSTGVLVPTLELGQTFEWAPGIGAGKAWCLGNSANIQDSVHLRVFDGTSWVATNLDESIWPGSGAVLFGSANHIALTSPGNSRKMSWSTGDGIWHKVQVSGRVLGVTDSGIYTDGGGSNLVLVSWSDPSVKLRDLGIPPEPASRMSDWNGKSAFVGAHGIWVLDPDGWALRRSPSPLGIGAVNSGLLLSDPSGNLWNGTLK